MTNIKKLIREENGLEIVKDKEEESGDKLIIKFRRKRIFNSVMPSRYQDSSNEDSFNGHIVSYNNTYIINLSMYSYKGKFSTYNNSDSFSAGGGYSKYIVNSKYSRVYNY